MKDHRHFLSFFIQSLFLICLLAACGGSLSDEQRRKMKEGMDQHKIVKLSDSEIMNNALEQGKVVYTALEKINFDSTRIDSVAQHFHVRITWTKPGSASGRDIEQQLIEAYVMGIATGSLQDNIQKIRTGTSENYDSLVYSKPVVRKMPDGVENLQGMWNIYLSKKDLILETLH